VNAAFHAASWISYFQAVVAAAAALLGLLFVAVSLNVDRVLDTPRHRGRAREALGQLLVLLVLGVIVLVPDITQRELGAALLAYGIVVLAVGVALEIGTLRRIDRPERLRWLLRQSVFNIGILTILAGIGALTSSIGGLYWLVITTIDFFFWSGLNAWALLARLREPATEGGGR
jgi:modulator of FtsH protease